MYFSQEDLVLVAKTSCIVFIRPIQRYCIY